MELLITFDIYKYKVHKIEGREEVEIKIKNLINVITEKSKAIDRLDRIKFNNYLLGKNADLEFSHNDLCDLIEQGVIILENILNLMYKDFTLLPIRVHGSKTFKSLIDTIICNEHEVNPIENRFLFLKIEVSSFTFKNLHVNLNSCKIYPLYKINRYAYDTYFFNIGEITINNKEKELNCSKYFNEKSLLDNFKVRLREEEFYDDDIFLQKKLESWSELKFSQQNLFYNKYSLVSSNLKIDKENRKIFVKTLAPNSFVKWLRHKEIANYVDLDEFVDSVLPLLDVNEKTLIIKNIRELYFDPPKTEILSLLHNKDEFLNHLIDAKYSSCWRKGRMHELSEKSCKVLGYIGFSAIVFKDVFRSLYLENCYFIPTGSHKAIVPNIKLYTKCYTTPNSKYSLLLKSQIQTLDLNYIGKSDDLNTGLIHNNKYISGRVIKEISIKNVLQAIKYYQDYQHFKDNEYFGIIVNIYNSIKNDSDYILNSASFIKSFDGSFTISFKYRMLIYRSANDYSDSGNVDLLYAIEKKELILPWLYDKESILQELLEILLEVVKNNDGTIKDSHFTMANEIMLKHYESIPIVNLKEIEEVKTMANYI